MTITTVVAIYAAVVSTIVLVWDVVKWRRSEKVRLHGFISHSMKAYGSALTPTTEGMTYCIVRLANQGKVATELSLVEMRAYPNLLAQLRNKPSMQSWVNHAKEIRQPA